MWSDPNFINLVYILTAMLLPIIPAYIVFKFLPTEANVGGPFHGLNLRLTGAFGGYFILVILILFAPRPKWEPEELWTVRGAFSDDTPISSSDELLVTVYPPPLHVFSSAKERVFETKIQVPRNNGTPVFPTLTVDREPAGQFEPAIIHLDTSWANYGQHYDLQRDEVRHEIDIKDKVSLKKNSNRYNPAGTQ